MWDELEQDHIDSCTNTSIDVTYDMFDIYFFVLLEMQQGLVADHPYCQWRIKKNSVASSIVGINKLLST
jgi:hypothetical protein